VSIRSGISMNRLGAARVVATVCSGLMAGLLFGDWLGPSFARAAMNASSFVQFQQVVHINYLRTLPALSTLAVAAPILWLVALRARRSSGEFKLLLGATAAIVTGYTITFVFNVPINNQLEAWNVATPPANAREIWSHWERAHVVRTIFWLVGFVLEAVALAVSASLGGNSDLSRER
jgi:uncharacterized membrane protein